MTTTAHGGGVSDKEAARLQQLLKQLADKANTGDRKALADLRAFMDDHPEVEEHVGDLAKHAEAHWISLLTGDDCLTREAVTRHLAHLKANLGRARASPVEKLVIDLVAITYLAERQAEIAAASAERSSIDQAAFRLKRAESAQRRFLNSLKMLSQMRALLPQGQTPGEGPRLYDPARKAV